MWRYAGNATAGNKNNQRNCIDNGDKRAVIEKGE
jgi:hypothetical protein